MHLIIDLVERPVGVQMGIDEALFLQCKNKPIVRFYTWENFPITIGYFTKIINATPLIKNKNKNPISRRITGGGIVEHGNDTPFSIIIPKSHPTYSLRPLDCYKWIHECMQKSMQEIDLDTKIYPQKVTEKNNFCFQKSPSTFDLIGEKGKKLVGGALKKNKKAILYQGSIQKKIENTNLPNIFLLNIAKNFEKHTKYSSEILESAHELSKIKYSNNKWNERK